jgi:(1->4)-alpha-D-glucan 1-alpha-D-glucosylmutase
VTRTRSWTISADELAEKIPIPILGDQYGEVLERPELKLTLADDGAFAVRCYEESPPIAPDR